MKGKLELLLASGLTLAACRRGPGAPVGPLEDLARAAAGGDARRVSQLLEADPGLARASWDGAATGPVRAAAAGGHLDVLRLLVDAGADPRERDARGRTPLHEAKGREVLALLLRRGAPPDVRSNDGETPLMTCGADPDLAEALLAAGARPNLRDAAGLTALHHAVDTSHRQVLAGLAALCSYGADPRIRDEKGESAADLARRFATEGAGSAQGRLLAEFLAPGGDCDLLREEGWPSGPASRDRREAVVHAAQCRGGNAGACGRIGFAYENGRGVTKDPARAAAFYEKSCSGGHPWGCYALAYACREGWGVAKDVARAADLFRKACEAGHAESCSQLAWQLQRGSGVAPDESRAVQLFEKACRAGEAWSCWHLSLAYEAGRGVPRDGARAAELRGQACRGGEKRACGVASSR